MKVDPVIKQTITAVSARTVELANDPTAHFKYLRRLIRFCGKNFSDEEKAYIAGTLLEMIHYKSIVTDPEMILQASNIKMRTVMFTFAMTWVTIIIIGFVFKTNESLSDITDYVFTIFKALSLSKGTS